MSKNFLPDGKAATPFNPQLEHFDMICGQVMKENRILKYVVIVSCLAFFFSIGITLYAISLPDSIPVLVTMNDFGETKYVGEVSRRNFQNFNVPEIAIQYQVKEFINLYNTLSTDRTVMKKSIDKTYHLLTSVTASKYSSLVRETQPFEDFGTRTREVFFQTEPLQLSNDTYQVDYTVITRQLNGTITDEKNYRALITIKVLQPSADDIKDNPLGIYITSFDMKPLEVRRN